jgi:hypothetical protein
VVAVAVWRRRRPVRRIILIFSQVFRFGQISPASNKLPERTLIL